MSGRVPCDVRRTIESVASAACSRSASTPASFTAAAGSATPASAASALGVRRLHHADVDCFGFTSHDHQNTPLRTELDDLAGRLVNRPDVVLRIDPDVVRLQESVNSFADLA